VFTAAELDFLRSQRIGRFATVGPSGWPHVTPVMYTMNDDGSLDFDVDGVKLRNLVVAGGDGGRRDGAETRRCDAGSRLVDRAGSRAPSARPQVRLGPVTGL